MSAARPRLVVLVSGSGTNLQAVIDACACGRLDATVAGVVSNVASAYGLERARAAGIPTVVLPHGGRDRANYDRELADVVASHKPHLVVLAGWMRILTDAFLSRHPTINLHPAQPGAFPGVGAIEAAFEAWQRGEVAAGGVMVHHVPDEGVDNGPVIVWEPVPFRPGDTLDSFTERVHTVEHRLLVSAIAQVLGTDLRRPAPPPAILPGR
ncbi:MAG: phosphoribosylglycinamide formyltransferase [Acidimicrobiia bacterium]|nr:phosphoribosylglycinamide formyltransferase [Acidimicrobiia bacterium]MDH4364325.1 phosphoribosylglycinamide formyltransferase [Acidimicrobiia bacterium]